MLWVLVVLVLLGAAQLVADIVDLVVLLLVAVQLLAAQVAARQDGGAQLAQVILLGALLLMALLVALVDKRATQEIWEILVQVKLVMELDLQPELQMLKQVCKTTEVLLVVLMMEQTAAAVAVATVFWV
jgi:hypothetical protein